MAVQDSPARDFLQTLAGHHPAPQGILMISAHWETPGPAVGATEHLETIHDYHGFPEEYYRFRYPARGDPVLARRAASPPSSPMPRMPTRRSEFSGKRNRCQRLSPWSPA